MAELSRYPLLLLLPLFLLTACTEKLTPQQVAEQFWLAVEKHDVQRIQKLTAKGTISSGDISRHLLPIRNVSFAKTIIDGEQAEVETEVEVMSDKPLRVPLKTLLVQQDDIWLVDYNSTVAAVRVESSLAKLLDKLRIFSDEVKDQVNDSIHQFEQKVPEIERKLEEAEGMLKEKIPEIREQVEEFTRQLEELLKRPSRSEPDTREAI